MSGKKRKLRKNRRQRKARPPAPNQDKKTLSKNVIFWLGGVASIVTILAFALDLPKKISGNFKPASSLFYGVVKDQSGAPVTNADLFVLEKPSGDTLGFGQTGANGDFSFTVKARQEESVFLEVKQNDVTGFRGHVTLSAGKRIDFRRE